MNFKKELTGVAAKVAEIMEAELSAKQKAIAKLDHPKHKIDSGDLAKLRAGHKPVKEEAEQVEEGIEDKIEAARKKAKAAGKKVEEPKKPAAPAKRKVEGKAYGGSKQKEEMDESVLPFTAMLEAYTEHGLKAFIREQVEEEIQEEVDNETFEKEVEDQKASMEGKKKQPKVAAAATQGVKIMDEEVELTEEDVEYLDEGQMRKMDLGQLMHKHAHLSSQAGKAEYGKHRKKALDAIEKHVKKIQVPQVYRDMLTHSHNHQMITSGRVRELKAHEYNTHKNMKKHYNIREDFDQIEERTLTEPETKKKEEYVKGMKKKLSGFKQRYGERAKEVMYATATKMAKKD